MGWSRGSRWRFTRGCRLRAITAKGIFDYATGKWAPAKFHNYVTGEWTTGALSADVTIPVGTWDPVLGRTYVQIARAGLGRAEVAVRRREPGARMSRTPRSYHLWAAAPAAAQASATAGDASLFRNTKVEYRYQSWRAWRGWPASIRRRGSTDGLRQIETGVNAVASDCREQSGVDGARKLAAVYRETLDLYARVGESDLSAEAKSDLQFELREKIDEFQTALKDLLGLDMIAFRTNGGRRRFVSRRYGRRDSARRDARARAFEVRVHAAQAG